MLARALPIFGAMVMTGVTAHAYPSPPPYIPSQKPTAEQINENYRQKLEALRAEVIATQERDGGALTQANRAALQKKLDRIHAELRREIRDIDVYSVSSDGQRVR